MENFTTVKIEVYTPEKSVDAIKKAAHTIGAGSSELYDNTASETACIGYWRPLENANPHIGTINEICKAKEIKIEIQCKRDDIEEVVKAIKLAHPYEVPAINIIPLVNHLFNI